MMGHFYSHDQLNQLAEKLGPKRVSGILEDRATITLDESELVIDRKNLQPLQKDRKLHWCPNERIFSHWDPDRVRLYVCEEQDDLPSNNPPEGDDRYCNGYSMLQLVTKIPCVGAAIGRHLYKHQHRIPNPWGIKLGGWGISVDFWSPIESSILQTQHIFSLHYLGEGRWAANDLNLRGSWNKLHCVAVDGYANDQPASPQWRRVA